MRWFELLMPLKDTGPILEFEGIPIRITRELPESERQSLVNNYLTTALSEVAAAAGEEAPGIATDTAVEPVAISFRFKATLHVTELLAFKECPRRYFWKYRLGLEDMDDRGIGARDDALRTRARLCGDEADDDDGSNSPDIGIRIGKFIHQIARLAGPDWPEELWAASFSDLHGTGKEELKVDLKRMWNNLQYSPFAGSSAANDGEHWDEVPFKVRLTENVFIEGRFDRLFLGQGGKLVLVDYKTHRIRKERVETAAMDYLWQLQLYALAVEALWGRLPDQAVLYFIYPDRWVEAPLQRELLEQTKREVLAIAEFSGTHQRLQDYGRGKNCGRCGYRGPCCN